MKRRSISLLLAMAMILALIPTAFAVYSYHMDVTVEEPVVGAKPAATAVSRNNKDTDNPKAIPVSEPPQVKWSGEPDANGCFKAGMAYTVTVTERMDDARWSKGTYNFKTAGAVINLHKVTDAVLSEDGRTVTGSYTFPDLKTQEQIAAEEAQKEAEKQAAQDVKDEKEHAADLARRWSQAEAGTGKTTLSPNSTCTIEQAIAVASRSLYADRTGWYQKSDSGNDWLIYGTRVWVYYKCVLFPGGDETKKKSDLNFFSTHGDVYGRATQPDFRILYQFFNGYKDFAAPPPTPAHRAILPPRLWAASPT